ncbi:DUF4386 domain-containing protein [Aerococcaceae bacterium 50-4]
MLRTHRQNAIIIGIFYIVAFVAAVFAVILYEPILANNWYQTAAQGLSSTVLLGVTMDFILLISAIGTTSLLAPYLSKVDRPLSLAYFAGRFMEAVFIGIGIVAILALHSLSQGYADQIVTNIAELQGPGLVFQGIHRWIMVLGPNLMVGINTAIYAYLLLHSGLVPRKLALFGILTALLVFVAGFLDLYGIIAPWSTLKGLISLPIGIFEMSLAFHLLVKGFSPLGLAKLGFETDAVV